MTKLEAVNRMLESIGESAVSALETGQATEAGQAESILDDENKDIQSDGWIANTEFDKEFTPTAGQIAISSSILRIIPSEYNPELAKRISIRNGYLWDSKENANNQWTSTVKLTVISLVDFTYISRNLAQYIVAVASARFQRFKKRGVIDEQLLERNLAKAKLRAMREDNELRQTNMLNTPEARSIKGNRYGYEPYR